MGFEPTVLSHTAFRERHHQPLGHLSAREDSSRGPRLRLCTPSTPSTNSSPMRPGHNSTPLAGSTRSTSVSSGTQPRLNWVRDTVPVAIRVTIHARVGGSRSPCIRSTAVKSRESFSVVSVRAQSPRSRTQDAGQPGTSPAVSAVSPAGTARRRSSGKSPAARAERPERRRIRSLGGTCPVHLAHVPSGPDANGPRGPTQLWPSSRLPLRERSPSGLWRRTGNAVRGNASRVRIPPSPPPRRPMGRSQPRRGILPRPC